MTAAGSQAEDGPPRTALQLLRSDRPVLAFFLGKVASSVGVWIHNISSAILVFEISRSAFLVGMVSVVQFTPQLIVAPLAGAFADRGNRAAQVIAGRLLAATGSGVVMIVLLTHGLEGLSAGIVIAMSGIVGIGFSISNPAMHAFAPSLVRRVEVRALVAIDTAPVTIARSAGPAIAGALLLLVGPASAYATAAAGQLLLISVFLWLGSSRRQAPRQPPKDRSIFGGITYLRQDRVALLLLVGVVGVGVGVDPVITLTPAIAALLDGGPSLVAALTSAFGVGTASSPLVLGMLRRRLDDAVIAMTGLATLTIALAVLAVSSSVVLAVASLYVGGIGMMLGITAYTAQLQGRLDDDMRGRIMGLWQVCFVGSRPMAAAFNGWIADTVSTTAALLITSALLTGIVWMTRPAKTVVPPPVPPPDVGNRGEP